MNVYAPTSSSIILFAGNSNEKRSLRKILKQSLGITGILGIASFLFGWVLSNLRPETIVDTDTDPSNPVLVMKNLVQFLALPEIAFLLGGIFVILLTLGGWYLTTLPD